MKWLRWLLSFLGLFGSSLFALTQSLSQRVYLTTQPTLLANGQTSSLNIIKIYSIEATLKSQYESKFFPHDFMVKDIQVCVTSHII